ncbi:MAG: FxLYD domain-containing protein, partial [Candidatus Brocadiales bacterium]
DEQTSIHKMVSEKTKEGTLFSVEEAEQAAEHLVTPSEKRVRKPIIKKRRAEKAEKKERKKVAISRRKAKKKGDWVKIELGFAYKNIQLHQGSYTFETHFIGEMVNDSGRNFGIVKFMFSTYDRRGKLVSEEAFQITDFYSGQIKTFQGTVVDGYKDIASHKVRFISAAPTARG